jgi:hypothetical protein
MAQRARQWQTKGLGSGGTKTISEKCRTKLVLQQLSNSSFFLSPTK